MTMKKIILAFEIIAAFATAAFSVAASPTAQAAERQVNLDCTVEGIVERGTYVTAEAMWANQHPINKPEYRRITLWENRTLTYGVGGADPKNWTMPIVIVNTKGENGFKNGGIVAQTDQADQWGYRRWLYLGGNTAGDVANGFWTTVIYPDHTLSGALGTCVPAPGQELPAPSPQLRDPNKNPKNKGEWMVPFIQSRSGGIMVDGKVNDQIPVRWALDTGATMTNIPYSMAVQLGAKVVREQEFYLADGSRTTNQVVIIKRISIGDAVHVDDIEASVGDDNSPPLLGKNFLDAFSSYEINNAQSHLFLRQ
jgi:clan AA aspartic protease (TIGR02281 family)